MIFTETPLKGAFLVDLEERGDERGFFARTYCAREFAAHGLHPAIAQCNLSYNYRAGTLRGMHYQTAPAPEAKLVRCTRGAIYDVIIDLRPGFNTYRQHFGVELSEHNRRALYVPEHCAHGYQTLCDGTEVIYQVSEFYTPGAEWGLRYDDPAFGIDWPVPVTVISGKDRTWPYFALLPTPTQLDAGVNARAPIQ
ncbi:dTDP-4-dehydrorhamnose 3,5-epimerase [Anthocerotibacter panamensis]|uniref:dTDP-4-dehydrorhamnose 3,5-epimerase n=1 Tax=Anthocerotibacter panamensis TaxID=2857077 RepID=UPI001C403ECA|nr:dTDP-4-dehydrorhamnose 3,5-epimerase [Anthocerotibacter panamensis]